MDKLGDGRADAGVAGSRPLARQASTDGPASPRRRADRRGAGRRRRGPRAAASSWDGGDRAQPRDERVARGGHAARARRHLLLPTLHAVQARIGWISRGALNYVCQRLDVPPAEAYGVATFYALFSLEPGRAVAARLRRHRLPRAARRSSSPSSRAGSAPGRDAGRRRHLVRSPAWACANGRRPRCLAGRRARRVERAFGAGRPSTRCVATCSRGAGTRRRRRRPRVPQAGEPALRLLRRVGVVDPDDSTTTARTAATTRCAGARAGPGRRSSAR